MKLFYLDLEEISHIQLSQSLWKNCLNKGDWVVDATCGNGKDTLFLANQVLGQQDGKVFTYDIQEIALKKAHLLLKNNLTSSQLDRVFFLHKTHENFADLENLPMRLFVYNLGYLPGSDKTIFTKTDTTLVSIQKALSLTHHAISITCYPGHAEGKEESKGILDFLETYDSKNFYIRIYQNQKNSEAPFLIWIEKIKNGSFL